MARVWTDKIVQYPRRYVITNNGDGTSTLTPSEGTVTSAGTPINAIMMNGIESDITNVTNAVGNMSTAQTTSKTVVGAINELFQNANNGKTLIANVVGSPVLASQTFQQQSDSIQTIKNTLATNLTNKGQSTGNTETLQNMATKVGNIARGQGNATTGDVLSGKTFTNDSGTMSTGTMPNRGTFNLGLGVTVPSGYYSGGTTASGKRWASGKATSGTSLITFYYPDGGSTMLVPLVINSLPFYAGTIFVFSDQDNKLVFAGTNIPSAPAGGCGLYKAGVQIKIDGTQCYLGVNCSVPVGLYQYSHTWIAYEY